ncbi:MAG: adenosylcobinamide-GDP ribazoletransferase [Muribaculaceae bacterium]|nr:adenosylcobinamide-GDP ribazoletransferase [Muribaculaceae bacterium]
MLSRLCATIIFFTRLPLWRVVSPPAECYKRVVELWPLVGWLTGGVTAATLWCCSFLFPPLVAVVSALMVRVFLTGALHEDGLADWWDAFGGGASDRDRTLAIMKDSHIGTYGVIALIFYYLTAITTLASLPMPTACAVVFGADVWSKCCASQIINRLPYARTEQTAKNRTIYTSMSIGARSLNLLLGIAGLVFVPLTLLPAMLGPVVVTALAIRTMRHTISGYTGDCCGATTLMSELSFLLIAIACMNI